MFIQIIQPISSISNPQINIRTHNNLLNIPNILLIPSPHLINILLNILIKEHLLPQLIKLKRCLILKKFILKFYIKVLYIDISVLGNDWGWFRDNNNSHILLVEVVNFDIVD